MSLSSQHAVAEYIRADSAASITQPWLAPDAFPPVPTPLTYGYLKKNQFHERSLDDLIKQIRDDSLKEVVLVWTPDTARLTPPEAIPELFDAVQSRNRAYHKRLLFYAVINTLMGGMAIALTFGTQSVLQHIQVFHLVALGFIPLVEHSWGLYQLRAGTPERMIDRSAEARYVAWIRRSRAPWTWALVSCISVVGIVQFIAALWFFGTAHSGIEAAGIVKPAVRAGEWWRLLTGTLLHANPIHFLFNIEALFVLGKVIECTFHRTYVPIVFVISALSGSICSLLFLPDATSVGASGGIMGLLGMLVVLGWKRRDRVPQHLFKSLLVSIVYIGVSGLMAYQAIDNAAHVGGLVIGVLLGLAATRISTRHVDDDVPKPVYVSAIVAAAVIATTSLVCLYKLAGLS